MNLKLNENVINCMKELIKNKQQIGSFPLIASMLVRTKHRSKTPILTMSKKYLVAKNLWDNTICLSGLKIVNNVLEYVCEVKMVANVPFRDNIDMSTVTLGCLLIILN